VILTTSSSPMGTSIKMAAVVLSANMVLYHFLKDKLSLSPKWNGTLFPMESKVVQYVGNRMPFGMHTESMTPLWNLWHHCWSIVPLCRTPRFQFSRAGILSLPVLFTLKDPDCFRDNNLSLLHKKESFLFAQDFLLFSAWLQWKHFHTQSNNPLMY
jgi:hypothetical protein